jgi:hypothetical protein
VKVLFEKALRVETGADLAYYDESSVAGRLRAGAIRSGDIYSLESWGENVEVVEVAGSDLNSALVSAPDPLKIYRVATTTYIVGNAEEKLGVIKSRREGPLLRDLTVAYLRKNGFRAGSLSS